MKINAQIEKTLQEYNIPVPDGIAYLLCVYFGYRPSYTPIDLIRKMNVTNILGISNTSDREVIWNIPLFETVSQQKWDWVKEWNSQFGLKNRQRQGADSTVLTRMKAFFADNPDVRQEEVIGATQLYFSSVSDPNYLISSHYFIYKGVGKDRSSTLETWVQRYKELSSIQKTPGDNKDLSAIMQ